MMKKEIERLQNKYNLDITLDMEKSDPLDNRSPRCYRVHTTMNGKIICEYGFCKNWKQIIERFEEDIVTEIIDKQKEVA